MSAKKVPQEALPSAAPSVDPVPTSPLIGGATAASLVPQPKIVAAGIAGAITSLLLWALRTYAHVDLPAEQVAALTTLIAGAAGYLTSNR